MLVWTSEVDSAWTCSASPAVSLAVPLTVTVVVKVSFAVVSAIFPLIAPPPRALPVAETTWSESAVTVRSSDAVSTVPVPIVTDVTTAFPAPCPVRVSAWASPTDSAPPPGMDWETYLGPAAKVPYNRNRGLYYFRWFFDYGGGQFTTNGIHYLEQIHWALGQEAPLTVTALGGKFVLEDNRDIPDTMEALWHYPGNTLVTFTQINANGATAAGLTGDGGKIDIKAAASVIADGLLSANSKAGTGGSINITSPQTVVVNVGTSADVSGTTQGGNINLGGSFRGKADPTLANSQRTYVGSGASFKADASEGNAGTVVVWSDGDTIFRGDISAQATGAVGRGGLIEVSGKSNLQFMGNVTAKALSHQSGTVLFAPGDVTIGNAASTLPLASLNPLLQLSLIHI